MMYWLPLVVHDPLYDHPNYHHHHNHHLHKHHHHPHLHYHHHYHHHATRWWSRAVIDKDRGSVVRTVRIDRVRLLISVRTTYSSSSPRLTVVVQTTTTSSIKNNISHYHHNHMDIIVIDRVLPTDDHISLDRLQLKGIHTSFDLFCFEIIVAIIR